jgi:hypothetical protein
MLEGIHEAFFCENKRGVPKSAAPGSTTTKPGRSGGPAPPVHLLVLAAPAVAAQLEAMLQPYTDNTSTQQAQRFPSVTVFSPAGSCHSSGGGGDGLTHWDAFQVTAPCKSADRDLLKISRPQSRWCVPP